MKYNKLDKILYNKNNFIKFIIICILFYIIYLFYNKINENYVTYPSSNTTLYSSYEKGFWDVPTGVDTVTFTVVGGKGGNSYFKKGGNGAQVVTKLAVTPGTRYYIFVGANGRDYGSAITNENSSLSSDNNNLFSGGIGNSGGGGGGAASFVSTSSEPNLIPIIIAGGGGGSGIDTNGGIGCNDSIYPKLQ